MSLGAAIAAATGLDPETDFQVVDDGRGAISIKWDSVKLGRPMPSQEELAQFRADYDAQKPQRDVTEFIDSIMKEYVSAMIRNDLFADSSALTALIAKVKSFTDAQKSAVTGGGDVIG